MDRQLIHLLDSSNVSERERAIKAMARSGDPAYIQYLNVVTRTDPNADIRALAEKAIRYIHQQQGGEGPISDEVPTRTTPKRVEVSAADERRAANMLDRAMELSTRHRNDEARELVVKAYKLDPNIRLDSYKRGIVGTVMGVGANEAFDILDQQLGMTEEKTKRKSKPADKAKNEDTAAGSSGWGSALLDLLIYGAVVAVSIIVSYFLIAQFVSPILRQIDDTPEAAQFINQLISAGAIVAIIQAVIMGVVNIVVLFISTALIHGAAKIIGGEGSLARLINNTVPLVTIFYVILFVYGLVSGAVYIGQLNAILAENSQVVGSIIEFELDETSLAPLAGTMSLLSLVPVLLSFGYLVVYIGRVGATYEFGWLRGCFATVLGFIFIFMLACGLVFVSMMALAPTVSGVFNTIMVTLATP